jgi:general secretion pathway protein F
MPKFVYEAVREPGSPLKGEIEADDVQSAATALLSRGYHVIRMEDVEGAAAKVLVPRLGGWSGLKRSEHVRITRDLASLIKAGLPLSHALASLGGRLANVGWKSVLSGLRARLEDGQSFSEGLASYPLVYDSMYINLVRAGEESGTLVETLERLARVGEQQEEIRSKVKMAMVYPAVMLIVGAVAVFVMLSFVVPMFTQVFEETNQALPLPTQILVGISDFLQTWWWAVLLGLPVLVSVIAQYLRIPSGKRLQDGLIVRLPVIGPLVGQTEEAAFSRTLGTLLGSGLPIVNSLNITSQTLRNTVFSDAVLAMAISVRDGESLSDSLERQPLFTDMMASIVSVGERSGDLSGSLHQIADEYERQIDRAVKVAMTLLEPAMIVLLGGVVGFIVLAMLLPIFSLGDTIQM